MKHYPVLVKKIFGLGTSEERLSKRSLLRDIWIDDGDDPTSTLGQRHFFHGTYCEVVAVDANFYTREDLFNEPIVYVTEKKVHPILGEDKLIEIAAREVEGAVKDSFLKYSENCGYEIAYCDTPKGCLQISCQDCSDFHIEVYERSPTGYHLIRSEDFCPKEDNIVKEISVEKE